MLGVYNYTVILTYLGMLFSFAGIHFVFSDMNRSFVLALLCLMISAVMDMFDGKVASTKKNRTSSEKLFGIQIDSMADIISYGVFPSLIVYKLATLNEFQDAHPVGKYIVICICAAYLLCALIRLSYFNVDEMERQNKTDDCRHEYRGLPVTSVALILPFVFIVSYFSGSSKPPVVPCSFLLAVMGLAFITPFKLIKPALIGKIIMIVIGVCELTLLFLGKAYVLDWSKEIEDKNKVYVEQSFIWDSNSKPAVQENAETSTEDTEQIITEENGTN